MMTNNCQMMDEEMCEGKKDSLPIRLLPELI
jgi:hypothetical protein